MWRIALGITGDPIDAEDVVQDAMMTAFLAMVATLPVPHRAVIVLRYGQDHTPQEIADTLDLRVGTVHSRLARALSSLRQAMDAHHV